MEEVPILLAIKVVVRDNANVVGAAFVNPMSREIGACEFTDDNQLTALEGVIVQLGARECIVPREATQSAAGRRLRDVLSRCGVLANEQKDSEFSAKDVDSDLQKIVSGNIEVHRPLLDKALAVSAIAALVRVAELAAEASADSRKYQLSVFETGKFMRLDASASRALNVTKDRSESADTFSLYKLMNRAKTPMGKRLLLRWLHQPLLDVAAITRRLDIVEALSEDAELRSQLRGTQLRTMPDVERLALKLERRKASLVDLCRLYQASCAVPLIADALRHHEGPHAAVLRESFGAPEEAPKPSLCAPLTPAAALVCCSLPPLLLSFILILTPLPLLPSAPSSPQLSPWSASTPPPTWASSSCSWRRRWTWTGSRMNSSSAPPTTTRWASWPRRRTVWTTRSRLRSARRRRTWAWRRTRF